MQAARARAAGAAALGCLATLAACTTHSPAAGHGAAGARPVLSGWRSTAEADVALRLLAQPATALPDKAGLIPGSIETDELQHPQVDWCAAGLAPSDPLRVASRFVWFTISPTRSLLESLAAYQGRGAEMALAEMKSAPAACPHVTSPASGGNVADDVLKLVAAPADAPPGSVAIEDTEITHPLDVAPSGAVPFPGTAQAINYLGFRCHNVVIVLMHASTSNGDLPTGQSYLSRAISSYPACRAK